MKRIAKGFTILEVVVVVAVAAILLFLLCPWSSPFCYINRRPPLIVCTDNLKQIGIAVSQYEMNHKSAPAYSEASAAATADGNLTAANLLRVYGPGLHDNLYGFRCPLSQSAPTITDAAPATVRNDPGGGKYTDYNLTTCYDRQDPKNKIIVADMPFAPGNVVASIHDAKPTKIDVGPNCLFRDGHVKNEMNLCPEGSSECELSSAGNIYRVDGGAGKGKDTCILGVAR